MLASIILSEYDIESESIKEIIKLLKCPHLDFNTIYVFFLMISIPLYMYTYTYLYIIFCILLYIN